jgi:hypothetical protein
MSEERIARLRELIEGHHAVFREIDDAHHGPDAGSGLALKLAVAASEPWGAEGMHAAVCGARLRLFAANDHLNSLAMLLQPTMTVFGCIIVGRAGIEAAAWAHWLLEPAIGTRLRVARSMTERLMSAHEAANAERLLDQDLGRKQVLDEILAEGARLGLTPVKNNRKQVVAYDKARPYATNAVQAVLADHAAHGGGVYAYMSVFIHGTDYAGLQSLQDTREGSDEYHHTTEPVLWLSTVEWVMRASMGAHSAAFDRLITLNGWDRQTWDNWRVQVADQLRVGSTPDC